MVDSASLFTAYQGSLPVVQLPGATLTTRLHLAPWLRMGRVIPLIPLYALMMCTRKALLLPFMYVHLIT